MDSAEQFIYRNLPNSPTIPPSATMLFFSDNTEYIDENLKLKFSKYVHHVPSKKFTFFFY